MNELIKALHVIQDECNKHEECKDCPMSKGENVAICEVTDASPESWKINDSVKVFA